MSRWVLALIGVGFAVASAQAQPKPLWELKTFPDAKGMHEVRWVSFTPDGKKLAAQIADTHGPDFLVTYRLFVWDTATQREALNSKPISGTWLGAAMYANAVTKTGTVLLGGAEVRLTDGTTETAKELRGRPVGVWFHADSSNSLWLTDDDFGVYNLAYGKMPPLAPDPKLVPIREQWLKLRLPGKWDEARPVVTVNSDLTRLAVSSRRDRKLLLQNITVANELKLLEVADAPTEHEGYVSTLRFSSNGKTLATGSEDSSVSLWDVEKAGKGWKPRATVRTGNFTVSALAFSPDGRTLAAGTFEQKGRTNLYILDVAGGKLLGSYALPGALMSVAFSPDSKVLVTGNHLGLIQAWDAEALRNP